MAACQIQLGGIGNGFDSEKKPAYYSTHTTSLACTCQVYRKQDRWCNEASSESTRGTACRTYVKFCSPHTEHLEQAKPLRWPHVLLLGNVPASGNERAEESITRLDLRPPHFLQPVDPVPWPGS